MYLLFCSRIHTPTHLWYRNFPMYDGGDLSIGICRFSIGFIFFKKSLKMTKKSIRYFRSEILEFFWWTYQEKTQKIFWFFKTDLENVANTLFWKFMMLTKFYFSDRKFLNFFDGPIRKKTKKFFDFSKQTSQMLKLHHFDQFWSSQIFQSENS